MNNNYIGTSNNRTIHWATVASPAYGRALCNRRIVVSGRAASEKLLYMASRSSAGNELFCKHCFDEQRIAKTMGK